MESRPVPLCLYCRQSPSRPGDSYCCDGCHLLADLSGTTAESHGPETWPEDTVIIEAFGKKAGNAVRFECHVDPLACEACLQGLVRLEKIVPGVRRLEWNRRDSTLSFEFALGAEQPSRIHSFLQSLKLSPRWKTAGSDSRSQERSKTLRLGITAALAGNLMIFSVPIYAGLAGSMQSIFEWIQLFLFLPVLFWSARPVYVTALASLRFRQLSVDLPLTLAFLAGSVFSILSLARGGHDIYFDSLTGFLFLILWSRSLLERSLARYLEAPHLERFFPKSVFSAVRDGREMRIAWKDLQLGDELTVSGSDRFPADGILLSPSAEVETAWMTGEKMPHWRLKGSAIQAGSRLLSPSAAIRVTCAPFETGFAQLLGRLKTGGEKIRPSFEAKLGSALVITCFAAIAGLFLFGSAIGWPEILRRCVSLLIVACPCAVSFAAPLARAKANRLAFKNGFWVRDPAVWSALSNVRKIAFDKTGTLTGGAFAIAAHSPMIDDHWKRIILSLENISRHPIAESLRRVWGPTKLLPVADAKEIPGNGVSGRIDGSFYKLTGAEDRSGRLRIGLLKDGHPVVDVLLEDEVTAETQRALRHLREKYELFVVSGDQRRRVHDFGKRFDFKEENLFAELGPEEKAKALGAIEPDLFFGDGTNDLLALRKAPVSVAVRAASLEAQAACDIIMFDTSLDRVELLFRIARETIRLNRRNLAFALAYNLSAGAAALCGGINPLGAALLMPLSSVTLLASTVWGTRALRALEKKP